MASDSACSRPSPSGPSPSGPRKPPCRRRLLRRVFCADDGGDREGVEAPEGGADGELAGDRDVGPDSLAHASHGWFIRPVEPSTVALRTHPESRRLANGLGAIACPAPPLFAAAIMVLHEGPWKRLTLQRHRLLILKVGEAPVIEAIGGGHVKDLRHQRHGGSSGQREPRLRCQLDKALAKGLKPRSQKSKAAKAFSMLRVKGDSSGPS